MRGDHFSNALFFVRSPTATQCGVALAVRRSWFSRLLVSSFSGTDDLMVASCSESEGPRTRVRFARRGMSGAGDVNRGIRFLTGPFSLPRCGGCAVCVCSAARVGAVGVPSVFMLVASVGQCCPSAFRTAKRMQRWRRGPILTPSASRSVF